LDDKGGDVELLGSGGGASARSQQSAFRFSIRRAVMLRSPGEIPQYRHADGLTALKQATTTSACICYNSSFKIIPPFNTSIIFDVEK
jgi:hypothetical protein